MSELIYSEASGAQNFKMFGCSVKNISVQMGFNSRPIVFTINIIEEIDQDFTLDSDDIRSIQDVEFGELSILGIVQSWERTTTDVAGTGIYTIRITDCREVLKNSLMSFYASEVAPGPPPPSWLSSRDPSIVVDTSLNADESEELTYLQDVIDAVGGHTFNYHNDVLEADLGEIESLNLGLHKIVGRNRSLTSIINEVCTLAGVEWWVECARKSSTDNTIVITIRVVSRSSRSGTVSFDLDSLAALHANKIIRRKDGFESQNVVVKNLIWGGIRRNLTQISGDDIDPFWGFDSNDTPLTSPAYYMPGDPPTRLTLTTTEEMGEAINGELDGTMDATKLSVLKKYANDFWGKQFYFTVSSGTLPRYSYLGDTIRPSPGVHPLLADNDNPPSVSEPIPASLIDLPEIVPIGWWEGSDFGFTDEILLKLCTEDGRFRAFVRLPQSTSLAKIAGQSSNIMKLGDNIFSKCSLRQSHQYIIITMPVPMSTYGLDDTGNIDTTILTRQNTLSTAWIPMTDRRVHYGPWSNRHLDSRNIPPPGSLETQLDPDLVPWKYGARGVSNVIAAERLSDAAHERVDMVVPDSIINTGQLEVADIPRANVGKIISTTSNITEVFIQFNRQGITTRYVINRYTKGLGDFRHQIISILDRQQTEQEQDTEDGNDSFLDIEDEEEDIDTTDDEDNSPAIEELDQEVTELNERLGELEEEAVRWHGGKALLEFNYKNPTGGLGVITAVGPGPYYDIRRLNYKDIDPEGFALGGIFAQDEWIRVRNLAEPEDSPGWIPMGTKVTVNIFTENETGPFVPYIEQTPQVFAPPPAED